MAGNETLTLADQLSLLLDRTGYRAMLRESRAENMEQKLENLGELIDIAGGFHSAREFLDHAALATNHERGGDEEVVSLMTMHKAKGLEFPHVFLPAFEAGIRPFRQDAPRDRGRAWSCGGTRDLLRRAAAPLPQPGPAHNKLKA